MCVQANAPSMISILADGLYQLFYPARGMDGNAITSSKNFSGDRFHSLTTRCSCFTSERMHRGSNIETSPLRTVEQTNLAAGGGRGGRGREVLLIPIGGIKVRITQRIPHPVHIDRWWQLFIAGGNAALLFFASLRNVAISALRKRMINCGNQWHICDRKGRLAHIVLLLQRTVWSSLNYFQIYS